MNWFLLLIILAMAGGGYFEYQTLHGQVTVDQMQISDLKTKVQTALDDQQKSADAAKQLTASLTDAQAKAADLDKQLQTEKTALAAAQAQIDAAAAAAKAAASAPTTATTSAPLAFTTKLGTLTALDGKTYTACQLLKINTDSIVISNAEGVTQVALNVLPAATQKMLGYDAKLGALSNDQVQLLEQKRQTALASGN
jgi:DNA repair exonuclease SbcCD ATPase subunit